MPKTAAEPRSNPRLPDAGARTGKVRQRLLKWYDVHRRHLPWRADQSETPNPYHALVSEAMLQQTQVATVIPYFNRFIDALPGVDEMPG